ncbi:MAG: hypothetical protein R2865_16975, partial [Deinococcales bacterium]
MAKQEFVEHIPINPHQKGSLYRQIRRARVWLPLGIIGVVLLHQLVVVPLGGTQWQFWTQLLFYSILGPAATSLTLSWIAFQVREREMAQNDLKRLYEELQDSHALLASIQNVTEKLAAASDLESVLDVASKGITEVTYAQGTAVLVGESHLGLTRSYRLSDDLVSDAVARNHFLSEGKSPEKLSHYYPSSGLYYSVLSTAIMWGREFEGSIHAYYSAPPSPEQQESFNILASAFSSVIEAARSRTKDLFTLF